MQKPARAGPHSLVMKLMNSDTHSCTVSLASLCNLGVWGQRLLHYPADVCNWQKAVLLTHAAAALVAIVGVCPTHGRIWMSQPNNPWWDPATQTQLCCSTTR